MADFVTINNIRSGNYCQAFIRELDFVAGEANVRLLRIPETVVPATSKSISNTRKDNL